MAAVRQLQHAQQSGYADGLAVVDGGAKTDRPAVGADETVGSGCGGRGLAAVVGGKRLVGGVKVHNECATANARGLRLDEVQDQLRCDGRINSAAAGAQHVVAGACGVRVGRRNHEALGVN